MLTQDLNFTYKQPLAKFFIAVCIIITISVIVGIIITSILVIFAREVLGIHLYPLLTYALIIIGLLAWFFSGAVRKWFSEFAIDEHQVSLKKITGTSITLKRSDIQRINWSGRTITFIGVNDEIVLNAYELPQKLRIILFSLLTFWVPRAALPPDVQVAVQRFNEQAIDSIPILERPIIVSSSPRYVFTDINLFMFNFSLLVLALACLAWLLTVDFNIFPLLIFLAASSVLFLVLWGLLSRTVEVNNEGIKYIEGPRKRFLVWNRIVVIGIEPHKSQVTVWTKDDKYTRIHFAGLSPDNRALFEEIFFEQLYARKIPFSYS